MLNGILMLHCCWRRRIGNNWKIRSLRFRNKIENRWTIGCWISRRSRFLRCRNGRCWWLDFENWTRSILGEPQQEGPSGIRILYCEKRRVRLRNRNSPLPELVDILPLGFGLGFGFGFGFESRNRSGLLLRRRILRCMDCSFHRDEKVCVCYGTFSYRSRKEILRCGRNLDFRNMLVRRRKEVELPCKLPCLSPN